MCSLPSYLSSGWEPAEEKTTKFYLISYNLSLKSQVDQESLNLCRMGLHFVMNFTLDFLCEFNPLDMLQAQILYHNLTIQKAAITPWYNNLRWVEDESSQNEKNAGCIFSLSFSSC